MTYWSTLVGVSALAFAAAAAPALAQTQADDAAANATGAEIIVTAQRRSESIQKVPVSVTAVTADTLRSRQINDLTQLSRSAPSLQVGQDNSYAIRGVGTLAFASTIDSSVALAIDDVNYGRPQLGVVPFMDLARVEVLNGPQGLLFGKNASAGLLNVVTARPVLGEYSSATDLEFSLRDRPGFSSDAPGIIARETLNIPLGQTAALRVNGLYSYEEPPLTYVGTAPAGTRVDVNRRTTAVKGKFLFEPSSNFSIYVIGDYSALRGAGGIFTNTYRSVGAGTVNATGLALDRITPGPDNFSFGGDGGLWRDLNTGGAQASVRYTLDSGIEISNLAAWRFYDVDQQLDIDYLSVNAANNNRTVANYDQYSDELRLALPAENRLSGQVGLYAFKSTLKLDNQISGANLLPSFVAAGFPFCVGTTGGLCGSGNNYVLGRDGAYTLDTRSLAAFGQLTYGLTDALKLIAGGRVTNDKIDIDLTQGRYKYFINVGGPSGRYVQSYSNTDFSWKLGAQYQATPTIMAYGFYGRGYKGPGFNDQAVTATSSLTILPEKSHTLEVGLKSSFLDRRLVINLSAFTTKFDDYQVQSFDTVQRTFVVQNAAKVRSKGIEAAVTLLPAPGLTFNASASLLDSHFVSFPGAQCYPTQTTMGCSATVNVFDASGLRLPVSPRFTSSVQAIYEVPTGGSVVPVLQGNWYHRSSINYLINQAPGATFGPTDILGFSVGAKIEDHLTVTLFCKNCTNVHAPTAIGTDSGDASKRNNFGQATPVLTYSQSFNLDSVRAWGLSLGFKF